MPFYQEFCVRFFRRHFLCVCIRKDEEAAATKKKEYIEEVLCAHHLSVLSSGTSLKSDEIRTDELNHRMSLLTTFVLFLLLF